MDEQPPPAASPPEPPSPASPSEYQLPAPLSRRGRMPVASGAPRIPRALRAFNGMRPGPEEARRAPAAPAERGRDRGRERQREGLTIRDLLEQAEPAEAGEEGRFPMLRAVLGRLRRGASGRDG